MPTPEQEIESLSPQVLDAIEARLMVRLRAEPRAHEQHKGPIPSEKLKITLLKSKADYVHWSYDCKSALQEYAQWDPTNTCPLDTTTAKNLLMRNIDNELREQFILDESSTASEIWHYFKERHCSTTMTDVTDCLGHLAIFSFSGDAERMDMELNDVEKRVLKLKNAHGKDSITFTELGFALTLSKLPLNYSHVRSKLEDDATASKATNNKSVVTMDNLSNRVLHERNAQRSSKAATKKALALEKPERCDHFYDKKKCWVCHPELKIKKESNLAANKGNVEQCYPSLTSIFDSGTNTHILTSDYGLVNIKKQNDFIGTAGSQSIRTTMAGDLPFQTTSHSGLIKNMSVSHDARHNLLSVGELADQETFSLFTNEKCYVVQSLSKQNMDTLLGQFKIILEGERNYSTNWLYEISLNKNEKSKQAFSAMIPYTSKATLEEWHSRFNHLGGDNIDKLINGDMVTGITVLSSKCNLKDCHWCLISKSKRLPFCIGESTRATRAGELAHIDLGGPITPPSTNGYSYYMTITDDFSRYVVVYLLKRKEDAFEAYTLYSNRVFNLFNRHVSIVRFDNGELLSNVMAAYCQERGTHIQTTNTYTPQQNAVSERQNLTLMNCTRPMLFQSGLSRECWGEAMYNAAYTRNCSPASANPGCTPYELWFGTKPSVGHLRTFGEPAYVHVPKEKRKKLDKRATSMVFVGYSLSQKGYRLLNPNTMEIVISRDVRFVSFEKAKKTMKQRRDKLYPDGYVYEADDDPNDQTYNETAPKIGDSDEMHDHDQEEQQSDSENDLDPQNQQIQEVEELINQEEDQISKTEDDDITDSEFSSQIDEDQIEVVQDEEEVNIIAPPSTCDISALNILPEGSKRTRNSAHLPRRTRALQGYFWSP